MGESQVVSGGIHFTVYGTAKAQGNKTARHSPKSGKSWVVEGSSKSAIGAAEWRRAVADAARRYQEAEQIPLLDGALQVTLVFVIDRPKSVSPTKRPRPCTRPDPDKLARAVLDALKGTLIKDDGLVVDLLVHKLYGSETEPPQARITIQPAVACPRPWDR